MVHTSVSNLDLDGLGTVGGIVESMELAVAPGPGLEAGPACGEEDGYPIGTSVGFYISTQFTLRQFSVDQFSCAEPIGPGPGLVAIPLLAEDPQAGPAVLFSAPLATDDGAPLPDAQALLAAAAEAGNELEEAGEIRLLGRRVTGYADVGKAVGPVTLRDGKKPAILDLSPVDVTYPLDTQRGLVLVSAVAEDPEDLPAAEKLLERTAPSFGWAE